MNTSAREKKLLKMKIELENYQEKFESDIQKVCDFDVSITECSGDGFLLLNNETSNVASFKCLKGKTSKRKLTEEEHEKFCI